MGRPIEFDAVGVVDPEVEIAVEGGVVEGDAFTGESFDETVELGAEVGEIIAGEEATEVFVEGMVAVLSVAEVECGLPDSVAGFVKGMLGEEGAEDGFSIVTQSTEFAENGVGLMAGGGTPVAPEGGAVSAMVVIECGGEAHDVGGVVGFFLSGHDGLKIQFGLVSWFENSFFSGLFCLRVEGAHERFDSCDVGLDLPGRGSGANGLVGVERGLVDCFRPKVICSRTADGGLADLGIGVACEVDESAVILIENVPVVLLPFLDGWLFVAQGRAVGFDGSVEFLGNVLGMLGAGGVNIVACWSEEGVVDGEG